MGASKPLFRFEGKSVLERMAEAFRGGGVADVRVVGRHGDEALAGHAAELGLPFLENREPERGMAGSILVAAREFDGRWFCVCPADMPLLMPDPVRDCLQALRTGLPGVQPVCDGRRKHPVFLAAESVGSLLETLAAGGTLRDHLRNFPCAGVPAEPCWQFRDFDTPEDAEELLRLARGGTAPPDAPG